MGRTAALKPPRLQAADIGRVATAPIEDSPIPGALVTLCLTGPADAGQPVWLGQTPLASLVSDLVAASGGVYVEANGPFMTVRFADVHVACVTARRLQWGVQGLVEAAPASHLALTVFVQAGEDVAPGSEPPQAFPKNHAGKILLAGRAAKSLDPGFVSRTAAPGFTELVWRSPDEQATRASDERTLARFTAETHASAPAVVPGPVQPEPTIQFQAPVLPKTETPADSIPDSPPRRGNLIWAIVMAVVLITGGAIFYFTRIAKPARTQTADTTAVPAATQANTGAGSAISTPQPARTDQPQQTGPAQTAAPKSREKNDKNKQQANAPPATPPKEVPRPAPEQTQVEIPVPRGDCQYGPDQIPALLGRAESSRARGQYADARRLFTAVLACDRGNHRAEEGLQQVIQAIKAGGPSD